MTAGLHILSGPDECGVSVHVLSLGATTGRRQELVSCPTIHRIGMSSSWEGLVLGCRVAPLQRVIRPTGRVKFRGSVPRALSHSKSASLSAMSLNLVQEPELAESPPAR